MALTYKIDSIEYIGGDNPHFAITTTVSSHADATPSKVNSASYKALIYRNNRTPQALKKALDEKVLSFALEFKQAKEIEDQLSELVGQEFELESQ